MQQAVKTFVQQRKLLEEKQQRQLEKKTKDDEDVMRKVGMLSKKEVLAAANIQLQKEGKRLSLDPRIDYVALSEGNANPPLLVQEQPSGKGKGVRTFSKSELNARKSSRDQAPRSAKTKNGKSPAAPGGHNTQEPPKSKGKSKTAGAKPGKGKGHRTDKGKGGAGKSDTFGRKPGKNR